MSFASFRRQRKGGKVKSGNKAMIVTGITLHIGSKRQVLLGNHAR
jgi:hypothetical protein